MVVICAVCAKQICRTAALCGLAKQVNGRWCHSHCADFDQKAMFNKSLNILQENPWAPFSIEAGDRSPSELGRLKRVQGKKFGKQSNTNS